MVRFGRKTKYILVALVITGAIVSALILYDMPSTMKIRSVTAAAQANPGLSSDVSAVISGNRIDLVVPDGVDIPSLVLDFDFSGGTLRRSNGNTEYVSQNVELYFNDQYFSVVDNYGNVVEYFLHVSYESEYPTLLRSLSFGVESNPSLEFDLVACIRGTKVSVFVPYGFKDFTLMASVSTVGDKVLIGEQPFSAQKSYDFSSPVVLSVFDGFGNKTNYTVSFHVIDNGLKTVFLNGSTTYKASEYSRISLSIFDNSSKLLSEDVDVRIRGNSTAGLIKAGYKIKFDSAQSPFEGFAESKYFSLISNGMDATMLKHTLAYELWQNVFGGYGFYPNYEYVNMFLNGKYNGTYLAIEQIEVADEKINPMPFELNGVNSRGFACEFMLIQGNYEKVLSTSGGFFYNFVGKMTQLERELAQDYMQLAEDAVLDGSFVDGSIINLESFADWYIVNNIMKNTDSDKMVSTFAYTDSSSRLTLGPIWDFDLSCTSVSEGFVGGDNAWMEKILQSPDFTDLVKERWREIYPGLEKYINSVISENYAKIRGSFDSNYTVYDINSMSLLVYSGKLHTTGNAAVEELRGWIDARCKWLNEQWGESSE